MTNTDDDDWTMTFVYNDDNISKHFSQDSLIALDNQKVSNTNISSVDEFEIFFNEMYASAQSEKSSFIVVSSEEEENDLIINDDTKNNSVNSENKNVNEQNENKNDMINVSNVENFIENQEIEQNENDVRSENDNDAMSDIAANQEVNMNEKKIENVLKERLTDFATLD